MDVVARPATKAVVCDLKASKNELAAHFWRAWGHRPTLLGADRSSGDILRSFQQKVPKAFFFLLKRALKCRRSTGTAPKVGLYPAPTKVGTGSALFVLIRAFCVPESPSLGFWYWECQSAGLGPCTVQASLNRQGQKYPLRGSGVKLYM